MSRPLTTDEENVWRTLQDKEHIAKWTCRFFHRWTKWKKHSFSDISYGGLSAKAYRRYVMERECVNCGTVGRKAFNMQADKHDWK